MVATSCNSYCSETSDSSLGYGGLEEERSPPAGFIIDPSWFGEATQEECSLLCHCNERPHHYVCVEGVDVGRAFIGCRKLKWVDGRCDFTEWLDEPLNEQLKVALRHVWEKMVNTEVERQVYLEEIEATKKKMRELRKGVNIMLDVDKAIGEYAQLGRARLTNEIAKLLAEKKKMEKWFLVLLLILVGLVGYVIAK